MQRLHGIVPTEEGRYVMVSMKQGPSGWTVERRKRWNTGDPVRNRLLLWRGVHLGLPAHWRSRTSQLGGANYLSAAGDSPYTAQTYPVEHETHTARLTGNLLGALPDHAYLCTLPRRLAGSPPESFLAARIDGECMRIGVTIRDNLYCVFDMIPADPSSLAGHCARIRRFIAAASPDEDIPSRVYVLNDIEVPGDDEVSVEKLDLAKAGLAGADEATLRAAGVALTQTDTSVPLFCGPTEGASWRTVRSWVYGISLGLVLTAALLAAGLAAGSRYLAWRIEAQQKSYQDILASNEDIRDQIRENRDLSRKVLRLNRTFSRQTRWGAFLSHIGSTRPKGLYLQRLGTEQVQGKPPRVRCALAGWATDQALVTKMMSSLRTMEGISDISLAMLEQDPKNRNIARFRILCTLALVKE